MSINGRDPDGVVMTPSEDAYVEVQQSEEFRYLRKRFRGFVFPWTVFFLVWYFLYVILADFFPAFMSQRVVGNINIGLILGLLQFVTTFAITILYIRWADRHFDHRAQRLRRRIEGDDA